MNGIHPHTLGIALVLAVTSALLTGQFGYSAIEAITVCSLGALAISVALVCVACVLNGSSEPLRTAIDAVKREATVIVAIVRNAISR